MQTARLCTVRARKQWRSASRGVQIIFACKFIQTHTDVCVQIRVTKLNTSRGDLEVFQHASKRLSTDC